MRKDENKFLINRIYLDYIKRFPKGASFSEIISSFEDGSIQLTIKTLEDVKKIDVEAFAEIEQCVPYLLNIVSKPRSFIKTIEQKVQIDQAKHINFKAISKLSRDSKDWYARTLTSVKPKFVSADINEESIDIYENRLVTSLIDQITIYINDTRVRYDKLLSEYIDQRVVRALTFEFASSIDKKTLLWKLSSEKKHNLTSTTEEDIITKLDKIKAVQRKLAIIKRSEFYRILKRKRKVSSPIHLTNIFMFEHRYNQAYKLWKTLENLIEDEVIELDDYKHLEPKDIYQVYFILNLFAIINDLGYKSRNQELIHLYDLDHYSKDQKIQLIKSDDCHSLCDVIIDENCIKIILTKDNQKRNFSFDISYENFEELTPTETSDIIVNNLKKLERLKSKLKKYEIPNSQYSCISLDINFFKDNHKLSYSTIRRIYSIGDSFEKHESNWNDYKYGICNINPLDLQYNMVRLLRIFKYHILQLESINISNLQECPLCGDKHIQKENKTDYKCMKCSHLISQTYHEGCDPGHKKPILWIQYSDSKFLKNEDIKLSLVNESNLNKLRRIEIIMGQNAITSFDIQETQKGLYLKSRCPHCGEFLGQ